ncbi:dTDP-4-dehydrorhamnose reductase [Psychroserpens ponticola]|uniref:dTDP-4-dehydrorhamnose reductase n=1 Tax=Psychroserpens ponticola TaxID=2932268 RepID=A0ABY7RXH9_9FLAO|nr:dTDP-4-dehydrorhamnose reductase [Psychroserpens ponticola]WCO01654.1 dTDP-4-dehydrorhamnose reductase [Psychroserpens ponticola]
MKIKALITGAEGQLAKTIYEIYSQNSDEIEFTFANKEDLDITNKNQVALYFNSHHFDYCINCAAYTNVEQSEKTPKIAYETNSEAVKTIAEYCKNQNIILIHISTDYVFDGQKNSPYTISDLPKPINVYGKSKLIGEEYIQNIMTDFFIVRTSWLYSKNYGYNFYKTILRKAKTNEIIKVVDNQVSCPTDCKDLSNYIYRIIKSKSKTFGLLHFSGKNQMSWYGFAKQILKENKLLNDTNIIVDNSYVTLAKRPKYSALQITKL